MLVRRDLGLELLGKVAECQPDGTLIQVGTRGAYQGRGFTVSGRLQLVYGDGYWNEWFLTHDDGRPGWLGEAMGQYFLCDELAWEGNARLLSPPRLGEVERIGGRLYVALDTKSIQVGSYEGELPFTPPAGQAYASVDFRAGDGSGVTVDYLSDPPSLYAGQWLTFSDLSFQGLRVEESPGIAVPSEQVRSVNCTGCGAPFELMTGAQSRTYACQYCGSRMDSSQPQVVALGDMVERARELAERSLLPLGSELRLPEGLFRLIGYVESSTTVEGVVYPWTEFLLYNRWHGYRWLSLSNGHFTLFSPLAGVPLSSSGEPVGLPSRESLSCQGQTFRHFQASQVTTGRVVGEFYWRLRSGDTSHSWDYVAPPYLLSASQADTDITWSVGRYLTREERQSIHPALGPLRDSWSQAPHQPNPYRPERYSKIAGIALAVSLLLLISGALLPKERLLWEGAGVPLTRTGMVAEQTLPSVQGNLRLEVSASKLPEGYLELKAEIASPGGPTSSDATALVKEGRFSRAEGEMYFGPFAPGAALLKLTPTFGPASAYLPPLRASKGGAPKAGDPVRCVLDLKLYQMQPGSPIGSLFLVLLLLSVPPGLAMMSRNEFEKRRWLESDHG